MSLPDFASGPVSPWRLMWTAPAATLNNMLQHGQGDAWALPLLFGAGLLSSLAPQVREMLVPMLPSGTNVFTVAVVSGVLLGGLQALGWPPMLRTASKWLGGSGNLRASRLAAGWSCLPVLLSYILAPLGGSAEAGAVPTLGGVLFGFFSLLLSVWTLLLLVQSLAAAQRLSVPRAALSVLIGAVMLLAALVALGFLAALILVALGLKVSALPGGI
ncbi:hypothetical protein EHF33_06765 [Deinococcus psychrotolerans]|uniref:Yip1 domain-containing protein n=1 Tax=Deinococcus psychrotolerans TaxID=2489213 RepID=A0A3G8YE32_9DEIO|nr:YIP1 family protein [Deinococcus psychrotolerans]AZI42487.1 hypothetical protein EHF33_06765 [Deinococcus psychrotolerans]